MPIRQFRSLRRSSRERRRAPLSRPSRADASRLPPPRPSHPSGGADVSPEAHATFASAAGTVSAVTHPPPGVADRPERPPRRPTSPLLRKRHRAAFDHYAAPDGRVPIDAVVLALADLGSFDDDVDAELAGRLVAAHFNRGDGVPGVPCAAR